MKMTSHTMWKLLLVALAIAVPWLGVGIIGLVVFLTEAVGLDLAFLIISSIVFGAWFGFVLFGPGSFD